MMVRGMKVKLTRPNYLVGKELCLECSITTLQLCIKDSGKGVFKMDLVDRFITKVTNKCFTFILANLEKAV